MDVDPRLIRLATQLGRLVRAYGREATEGGHAAAALADAFGRGLAEEIPAFVEVALPLHDTGQIGDDLSPLDAKAGIQLEFYGNGIDAELIRDTGTYREGATSNLSSPFVHLELDMESDLRVRVFNGHGQETHCCSLAQDSPALKGWQHERRS